VITPLSDELIIGKWQEFSGLAKRLIERVGTDGEFEAPLGCAMAGDDSHLGGYQITTAFRMCLMASADHLHALTSLVVKHQRLHLAALRPRSGYTETTRPSSRGQLPGRSKCPGGVRGRLACPVGPRGCCSWRGRRTEQLSRADVPNQSSPTRQSHQVNGSSQHQQSGAIKSSPRRAAPANQLPAIRPA
jgi:hypothetical protein